MPNVNINTQHGFVNVISTHGHSVEVDAETLDRWNTAISKWWEVQLEMDKVVKQQNG
jgi:hypothetical protein